MSEKWVESWEVKKALIAETKEGGIKTITRRNTIEWWHPHYETIGAVGGVGFISEPVRHEQEIYKGQKVYVADRQYCTPVRYTWEAPISMVDCVITRLCGELISEISFRIKAGLEKVEELEPHFIHASPEKLKEKGFRDFSVVFGKKRIFAVIFRREDRETFEICIENGWKRIKSKLSSLKEIEELVSKKIQDRSLFALKTSRKTDLIFGEW